MSFFSIELWKCNKYSSFIEPCSLNKLLFVYIATKLKMFKDSSKEKPFFSIQSKTRAESAIILCINWPSFQFFVSKKSLKAFRQTIQLIYACARALILHIYVKCIDNFGIISCFSNLTIMWYQISTIGVHQAYRTDGKKYFRSEKIRIPICCRISTNKHSACQRSSL